MNGKWNNISLPSTSLGAETMILLTDGSVLIHNAYGKEWFKLTPDTNGNYDSGKWSSAINMTNTRQFFASGVLRDGRVFAIGGEYSDAGGDTPLGEIFDPVTNSWSTITSKTSDFDFVCGDCASCILSDGRVLLGSLSSRTAIWDPANDTWIEAGMVFGTAAITTKDGSSNEETWTLLPDGNVLTVETFNPNRSEKYIPSEDRWIQEMPTIQQLPISTVNDTTVSPPVTVSVFEIGPAILLPEGQVFAIGATGHTGIYTPPQNPTQQGTWAQGPDFPADPGNTLSSILTVSDGPACLLPNGKVLCLAGSMYRYSSSGVVDYFSKSAKFYLYTPSANNTGTITLLTASGTAPSTSDTWTGRFLLLPTGEVLFSAQANQLSIFTPDPGDGQPKNAWRPTILNCPTALALGHTYTISGLQINGLSQANSYGDDAQMATNFPLVQLQNANTGEKKFLRSFNFSSMGVATGASNVQSLNVWIPYDTKPGQWNLVIIANGIESAPFGVNVASQDCFFILDRSTFGEGEITALLSPGPLATIDPALYIVTEGFTPADCGINSLSDLMNPGQIPIIPDPVPGKISLVFSGPVIPENSLLPATPQRFTYPFKIVFQDTSPFNVAPETLTLTSVFTSSSNISVSSQANIYLVKNPNPYILHGDIKNEQPWYLSVDLRVFQVKAGDPQMFGAQISNAVGSPQDFALQFIQKSIGNLNDTNNVMNASYRATFDGFPQDEDSESLSIAPTDTNGIPVYNFALARVRLRDIQAAQDVRVFFRMASSQQTSGSFDLNTNYRAGINDSSQKIPLLGVEGDEIISIPFFATARVDSTMKSMSKQVDDFNVQTIPNPAGGEMDVFYGCWLDINQPNDKRFPPWMAGNGQGTLPDGPFINTDLQSIQQLVRSAHQCLIAEISYDPDSIPNTADPSISDKLAQRNITFVGAPNPGAIPSRRVPQTFEIKPTISSLPAHIKPDELMISWGGIPDGTIANIYLPAVKADELLMMANQIYPVHRLSKLDDNTIQCPADGVTYMPVPKGQNTNFAGLLTIDLPMGITKGQIFNVVVRQITSATGNIEIVQQIPGTNINVPTVLKNSPRKKIAAKQKVKNKTVTGAIQIVTSNNDQTIIWRRVLGVFKLTIPVGTKKELLHPEERLLSVLRWIQKTLLPKSRWYLVFQRYLDQIAGRIQWMGGDPGNIIPDPNGEWQKKKDKDHDDNNSCDEQSISGKICQVIYNCFGEFEGFVLETCSEKHSFRSCEKGIEEIVKRVCRERSTLTIYFTEHKIQKIIIGCC